MKHILNYNEHIASTVPHKLLKKWVFIILELIEMSEYSHYWCEGVLISLNVA